MGKQAGIKNLPSGKKISIYPGQNTAGDVYLRVEIPDEGNRYYRFVNHKRSYLEFKLELGMEAIKNYAETFLQGEETTQALEEVLRYRNEGIRMRVPESKLIYFPKANGKRAMIMAPPRQRNFYLSGAG